VMHQSDECRHSTNFKGFFKTLEIVYDSVI